MKKILVLVLVMVVLYGCQNSSAVLLYSPDRTQCITVFTNRGIRHIVDGNHERIPDTNYIKLDVSKVPTLGDGLWICWENQKYKWDIVEDKSIILESKIDTSKYRFSTNLPVDQRGIPTPGKYGGNGCAVFDFHRMKLIPDKGAIVEYK